MRTYMSDSVWALFMHEAIPISGGTGQVPRETAPYGISRLYHQRGKGFCSHRKPGRALFFSRAAVPAQPRMVRESEERANSTCSGDRYTASPLECILSPPDVTSPIMRQGSSRSCSLSLNATRYLP